MVLQLKNKRKYFFKFLLLVLLLFNPFCIFTPVALCGWAAKADDSIVCFGAKPDKGFLDMKSRRIRKWEGDAREAVDGVPDEELTTRPSRGSWRWTQAGVDDATQQRQLAAGQQRGEQQRLAWIHGGAVNTGLQRQ